MMDDKVISQINLDFERVMEWTHKIWGSQNFRIPTDRTKGTINMAIFETISYSISKMSDNFITKNKSTLKKNYKKLIENPIYYDAVTRSTNTRSRVEDRFRLAEEILIQNTSD